jgi:hypothetical protein
MDMFEEDEENKPIASALAGVAGGQLMATPSPLVRRIIAAAISGEAGEWRSICLGGLDG